MFGDEDMKIESRDHWLSKLTNEISDDELCLAIEEISEFRRTGVIPQDADKLKGLARKAADICKVSYSDMMRTVEDAILFEAARRYHNQFD